MLQIAIMNTSARDPAHRMTLRRAFVWTKAFVREVAEVRTAGMAAEMAFWLFLSLIPLAAVAALVAAKVAVSSADAAVLLDSLPPETRRLVARHLDHVAAWNGGAVGAPAVAVFFWLASGGVHAVFDLLEVLAGASRPWWKRRLIALATCLGLSLGTVGLAVLGAGLNGILAFLHGSLPVAGIGQETSVADSAVRMVVGFVTLVGLVAGLYFVGTPRRARKRLPVFPGALLAVALQVSFGYGYVFYLSQVGVKSAYSAGLSIIGVTMIALYLFSIALLVGAELNHMLGNPEDRQRSSRMPPNAR
jgi:membrane protein